MGFSFWMGMLGLVYSPTGRWGDHLGFACSGSHAVIYTAGRFPM